MSNRARAAVLLGGIALLVSGASTVFLIGSSNRRADREAVLRYEAAVLAQVREMNVLGGSMMDAVDAFKDGKLAAAALSTQTRMWSERFHDVSRRLAAVPVPAAIGSAEPMFEPAARSWALAATLYSAFASCAERPNPHCIQTGKDADDGVQRALSQYGRARTALQAARSRLGLGTSPNFGDPPR